MSVKLLGDHGCQATTAPPLRPPAQVLFLLYHYFNAKEIYNAIRVFIAAYVWMTGFGAQAEPAAALQSGTLAGCCAAIARHGALPASACAPHS